MAKIRELKNIDQETGKSFHHRQFLYLCPGCGYTHAFALKKEGGKHEFNMDFDNPTITPSLVNDFTPGRRCHSTIRNGRIKYMKDSWHPMAGQDVELPQIT
jgi:hypothetical protein